MMRLELATEAFIGARSQQQDAAAALSIDDNKSAILILADGLGGHEGGDQASWIVVDTFRKAAEAGQFSPPERRRSALRDALEAANSRIAGGANPAHGHRSMASTAVVAVVAEGLLNWISVGDSHLYLWRGGQLTKLNEDHSQAGLMVRSGQYKDSDPEVQAVKSVLVSALTGRKLEIVDHPRDPLQLETGDVLVLASDGLNTISEDEIREIVEAGGGLDAKALSKRLVKQVEDRKADRQDNTTVAIARVLLAPKRTSKDARTEVAPARQITTPTLLPGQQRTEFAPPPPKPRLVEARADNPAASAVTQRVEPVTAGVATTSPVPKASEAPSPAHVRTAAITPEVPGAPMVPKPPMPDLRASKPLALPDTSPARSPAMGLLGVLMFVLAALLGAVALGKMAGFSVLDAVLGGGGAPKIETTREPVKPDAKQPAPATAPQTPQQTPPPTQTKQTPELPKPALPPAAAPRAPEPKSSPPEVLPPLPAQAPQQPAAVPRATPQPALPPAPAPRPAERLKAPPSPPPATGTEPGAGDRAPDPGQAPAPVPPSQSGAVPGQPTPADPSRLAPVPPQPAQPQPQPQQQLRQPGTQGGLSPVAPSPVRPSAPNATPRTQASPDVIERRETQPSRLSRGPCQFSERYGQFESMQQCRNACFERYGLSAEGNGCNNICLQLCR